LKLYIILLRTNCFPSIDGAEAKDICNWAAPHIKRDLTKTEKKPSISLQQC